MKHTLKTLLTTTVLTLPTAFGAEHFEEAQERHRQAAATAQRAEQAYLHALDNARMAKAILASLEQQQPKVATAAGPAFRVAAASPSDLEIQRRVEAERERQAVEVVQRAEQTYLEAQEEARMAQAILASLMTQQQPIAAAAAANPVDLGAQRRAEAERQRQAAADAQQAEQARRAAPAARPAPAAAAAVLTHQQRLVAQALIQEFEFDANFAAATATLDQRKAAIDFVSTGRSYAAKKKNLTIIQALGDLKRLKILRPQTMDPLEARIGELEKRLLPGLSSNPAVSLQSLREEIEKKRSSLSKYNNNRGYYNDQLEVLIKRGKKELQSQIAQSNQQLDTFLRTQTDSCSRECVTAITPGNKFGVEKFNNGVWTKFDNLTSVNTFLKRPETKQLILEGKRAKVVDGLLQAIHASLDERIVSAAELVDSNPSQWRIGATTLNPNLSKKATLNLIPGITIHTATTCQGTGIDKAQVGCIQVANGEYAYTRTFYKVTFPDGSQESKENGGYKRVRWDGQAFVEDRDGLIFQDTNSGDVVYSEPLKILGSPCSLYSDRGELTVYGQAVQKLLDGFLKKHTAFAPFWDDADAPRAEILYRPYS
jgi:hypothetical protein